MAAAALGTATGTPPFACSLLVDALGPASWGCACGVGRYADGGAERAVSLVERRQRLTDRPVTPRLLLGRGRGLSGVVSTGSAIGTPATATSSEVRHTQT
jgi:hypothetical protein